MRPKGNADARETQTFQLSVPVVPMDTVSVLQDIVKVGRTQREALPYIPARGSAPTGLNDPSEPLTGVTLPTALVQAVEKVRLKNHVRVASMVDPSNKKSLAPATRVAIPIKRVGSVLDNPDTHPTKAQNTALIPVVDNEARLHNRVVYRALPVGVDTTVSMPRKASVVP